MKPITHKETMAIQAGADALLTPGGGGIAVWVRRDELLPRVAVRFSTAVKEGEEIDAIHLATIIATLRVGLDRITHAMADQMGMERDTLKGMIDKAHEVLAPKYETMTNIVH